MGNSLEDLADARGDLLRAAAAAWIHDMGKCDDRFIEQEALDGDRTIQYDYKTAHLRKVSNIHLNLLGESLPFDELIEYGRPGHFQDLGKPLLVRLLGLSHSVAHTEKASTYNLAKQRASDTRLSTPFGHEFERLKGLQKKLDAIDFNAITTNPISFMGEVKAVFSGTLGDTRRPLNDVSLWIWSYTVAAFYKAALASRVLGSQDDLFKLHWRLLSVRFNGLQFLENVDRIPDLLARQKVLKDGLGKVRELLEFTYPLGTQVYSDENGSIFIVPDIANLLDLQNKQGQTLRWLILNRFSSGTIPGKERRPADVQLGGEVVPDVQLHDPWPLEEGPLGEEPWKHSIPAPPMPLNQQSLRVPTNRANFHKLNEWWSNGSQDRCGVCQLRPQGWGAAGTKALERKVCGICEERREDRSQQWAENLRSTIWLDEVADANGRVALIVGRFGLEHWLDGQTVFYPKDKQESSKFAFLDVKCVGERSVDFDRRSKHYTWVQGAIRSPSGIKESDIPNRFKLSQIQIDTSPKQKVKVTDVRKVSEEDYCITLDQILWGVVPNDYCKIRGGIFKVVGDGSEVKTTEEVSRGIVREQILQTDELFVERDVKLYPMEEAQTPARLYRVWETTLQFWQDLQDELGVGEVSPRLRIHVLPQTGLRNKLARFHTYELKPYNINLSVSMVADEEFITVDNLQRLATLLDPSKAKEYREDYENAASYVEKRLQELCRANKPVEIEEPTGYGSANRILGTLRITAVEPEKTPYVPAIPILTEPRTFMVLVSADKALQVVEAIKNKYEDEMGKVRNRLPLTVGIVFAGMRTPLPAILDAGRRMLQQQTEATEWWAKRVDKSSYSEKVVLEMEREGVQIPLTVKAVMDDGATEDTWYSYWCIAKERDILRPRKKKVHTSIDGKSWIHISDLQEGDIVSFMPSRLDFEFLDTASRRFEISYNIGGRRRGSQHPARPYYLEQLNELEKLWQLLSRGMETTQIHALIGTIEEKRSEWLDREDGRDGKSDEVFRQAVCDALRNANWEEERRPSKADFERLQKAALCGQLADVFELYMRVLKKGENE